MSPFMGRLIVGYQEILPIIGSYYKRRICYYLPMTHIIIHPNVANRLGYLFELTNSLMKKSFNTLEEMVTNPDIHMVNVGEKGSIGIEEVKELQKKVIYKPYQELVQLGIITEAHALTTEAQNALLKTLEEQPDHTEFILMVNNEKNLLETILSRGTRHYVKSESIDILEERPSVLDMDIVDQFKYIEELIKDGEPYTLINQLTSHYRDLMKSDMGNPIYQKNINHIQEAKRRLDANGNKRLVLENMMVQISP
jgi:DNA polymerase III gamma/tau subunit